MDPGQPHRSRVSRETRLLLLTACLAIAALWVLARVRFPDRPPPPNPVQPILTQLSGRPTLDDLAAEIWQLQPQLQPLLMALGPAASSRSAFPADARDPRPALRVRTDVAVVLPDPGGPTDAEVRERVIGLDPASGLAVVRVPALPAPLPVPWVSNETPRPRYLIASDMSIATLALRPVFVGSFAPAESPVWPSQIWVVPASTDLVPGSFVFTIDGRLAGLVVEHGRQRAILPAPALLAEVDRLLVAKTGEPGHLGITVQSLTWPVARATGSSSGVVVTWVDPKGPSAGTVAVGDVLEAADGERLVMPLHWEARTARLAAGESISVRVRRGSTAREVVLVAVPPPIAPVMPSLGLIMRSIPGTGAAVTRVDPGSVGERAGIHAGDVITRLAEIDAPTAGEIRRTFNASAQGQALLLALTRDGAHRITALEK
jgi:hypothetical protein